MAGFRTLDEIGDVRGRRVLVRVRSERADERRRGHRRDPYERVAPTLRELSDAGAKSHPARSFRAPEGKPSPEFSLQPVAAATAGIAGRPVAFAADCIGKAAADAVAGMSDGGILLLENTRFHAGEEKNDPAFAKALAQNGDLYVNDAFSAAHRAHASTEGVARLLPAFAGRSMQAELEALEKGLGNPAHPVVAVVGGAKVSSKIDLLMNLVGKVDALVIGGGMANTFLAARGDDVGKSLCEHDLADTARQIMIEAATAGCAIVLPSDAIVARQLTAGAATETVPTSSVPADSMILDVGPKTLENIIGGSTAPRRWSGTDRSALSKSSRSIARPSPRRAMRPGGRSRESWSRWRRRRHGRRPEPGRRGGRLHLCLDGRRRLPGMDGGQAAARRRGAAGSRQLRASSWPPACAGDLTL